MWAGFFFSPILPLTLWMTGATPIQDATLQVRLWSLSAWNCWNRKFVNVEEVCGRLRAKPRHILFQQHFSEHEGQIQGQHGPGCCQGEQRWECCWADCINCRDRHQLNVWGCDTCTVEHAAQRGEEGWSGNQTGSQVWRVCYGVWYFVAISRFAWIPNHSACKCWPGGLTWYIWHLWLAHRYWRARMRQHDQAFVNPVDVWGTRQWDCPCQPCQTL